MVREEVQSPKITNMLTTTKITKKVVVNSIQDKASEGNSLKTSVIDIDMMVGFISS